MGFPSILTLLLVEEREVNRIRIYPGALSNKNNPSGICAPVSYEIYGFVNNGWKPLVKVENIRKEVGNAENKDYFYEHRFSPLYLSKLRIKILATNDTGKRLANPNKVTVPSPMRISTIREIMLFGSKPGKHGLRARAETISGDFRAPFYRNSKQARLDVIVAPEEKTPVNVIVSIKAPDNKKVLRSFPFKLQKGMNKLSLNIAGLETGRYPVSVEIKKGDISEEMIRLLRINNGTPVKLPQKVTNVTGKRIYLFDDYYVESKKYINIKVNQTSTHLVAWGKLDPNKNHWSNKMSPLDLTYKGHLLAKYQDWETNVYRTKYKICKAPVNKPSNWQPIKDNIPKVKIWSGIRPSAVDVKANWRLKTPLDKAKFRFYDRKRDGIPPLNEILVLFTGTKCRDFNGLSIPYRSTFAVWEKRRGEILFLSKKPLVVDTNLANGDSFEKETDVNDNFGGQHLSKDGNTLIYFVSRVIKRFPPYIVNYDNLRNINRIMTAFYTKDGFNWKQQFILPVTEKDPWSLQQYGIKIFKDPKADLYWGFLASFNCQRQLMFIDIAYSRNLLNWTRPGDCPFIANSDVPGNCFWGLILQSLPSVIYKNKEFITLQAIVPWPHFYFKNNNSAENIKRRFGSRGIQKLWPYFAKIGGYKGLAKSMQKAFCKRPLGLAVARPGGYLAVKAENGQLISRPFKASGKLTINAKTFDAGKISVQLIDLKGHDISGFKKIFKGDKLDFELFPNLPSQAFKIKISIQKAELFALDFIK